MREIGGYIELDQYTLPMLHEHAIHLNCGRSCLSYIIQAKKIEKILLPYFICDSVIHQCDKDGVNVEYYHIDKNFNPIITNLNSREWLYIVNYYGQLTSEKICQLSELSNNQLIVDNAQAYFDKPVSNVDTLYTCRKFFGVPDGGILYTNQFLHKKLEQDESFNRMNFLLGRYERSASQFYSEYQENNRFFVDEPMKKMSKLTNNLLHALDYDSIKRKRTENYLYLYESFKKINLLPLKKIEGAFAYPLLLKNGSLLRKKLIEQKIYIPILWPNVLTNSLVSELEYDYANNILPIPCDQRYGRDDMEYICKSIWKLLEDESI